MLEKSSNEKKKVIVYGLGKCWKQYSEKIRSDYEIIFCSDQRPEQAKNCEGIEYIAPKDISVQNYDILILCSYIFGMREELILEYDLNPEKAIYCLELYENVITIPKHFDFSKNMNNLTIVIPTYNRKLRLEKTLRLLKMQSNQNFDVFILDDASDYDVMEIVKKQDANFAAKIKVERNISNLGLAGNTAMAFTKVDSGWIWTLADDDMPSIYAVEHIHREIENAKDVGIIMFSILNLGKYMENSYIEFSGLKEMLLFYQKVMNKKECKGVEGDFIFFSNKVFKVEYVKRYLKQIFKYLYTTIPQNMPILFGLDNRKVKFRISNKKIVSYVEPDGDHWNWLDNGLGMTTLKDLPLHITKNDKSILYRLCMFDYEHVIKAAQNEKTESAYNKLEEMYFRLYQYFLSKEAKKEYLNEMRKLKDLIGKVL